MQLKDNSFTKKLVKNKLIKMEAIFTMHVDMKFLFDLVLIIIAAGIGTFICKKFGQPKIVGQILAGVLIGPSLLGFVSHSSFINNLAEIGVILLMFLAGLETDFNELKESFERSSVIALGGEFSFPLL